MIRKLIALIVLSLCIAACSTASLRNTWPQPTYSDLSGVVVGPPASNVFNSTNTAGNTMNNALVINNPNNYGPYGSFSASSLFKADLITNYDSASKGSAIALFDRSYYYVSQLPVSCTSTPDPAPAVVDGTDQYCTSGNVPVGGDINICAVTCQGGVYKYIGWGPGVSELGTVYLEAYQSDDDFGYPASGGYLAWPGFYMQNSPGYAVSAFEGKNVVGTPPNLTIDTGFTAYSSGSAGGGAISFSALSSDNTYSIGLSCQSLDWSDSLTPSLPANQCGIHEYQYTGPSTTVAVPAQFGSDLFVPSTIFSGIPGSAGAVPAASSVPAHTLACVSDATLTGGLCVQNTAYSGGAGGGCWVKSDGISAWTENGATC